MDNWVPHIHLSHDPKIISPIYKQKIDDASQINSFNGFVGNGITAEIVEKLAQLQKNQKLIKVVKRLVDRLVEKQD